MRRNFLKLAGIGIAGIALSGYTRKLEANEFSQVDFTSLRPVAGNRKF